MNVYGIILAAGQGNRFDDQVNKMYVKIAGETPLERSIKACRAAGCFRGLVVVCHQDERRQAQEIGEEVWPGGICYATGGDTRQQSAYNGILALPPQTDIVAVHDGARCFVTPDLIRRCVQSCEKYGSGVAGHRSVDTVKMADAEGIFLTTLDREQIVLVETPQVFWAGPLRNAYEKARREGFTGTDDAGLLERMGVQVRLVESGIDNFKLTRPADFIKGEKMLMQGMLRIGQGFDVHRFAAGRRFLLGGVEIPFEKGLQGHSDADVLAHAVTDALLGAAAAGDIGELFPDTDPAYLGADSMLLLRSVADKLHKKGWEIGNVDTTVFLEKPKISAYKKVIEQSLAEALGISPKNVNVKAKTAEGMGAVGTGRAAAAAAVCTLIK